MDEIIAKLDEYIRERCEVGDDPEYGLDVNLFDTGFLDSMGAVDVIMFAEEAFGVEISQRDVTLYPMNTVNEIQRQIQLAEKLYKAISEGDLKSALSSLTGLSSRIESSLARIGVQSEIYSSLVDISSSSTQWSQHLSDPDYFTSVIQELSTLQEQISSETMKYLEDKKEEVEEDLESTKTKTDSASTAIESSTEADNKMVNELSEANSRTSSDLADESSQEMTKMNQEMSDELMAKAQYNKVKAQMKKADEEYYKNLERNAPEVDVTSTIDNLFVE